MMTISTKKSPERDPEAFLPLTELWFNILLALSDGPRHGYAIIQEIELHTSGAVSPATGTMYLALQRLEEDGLIEETDPATPEAGRRKRRFYAVTKLGKRVAKLEAERLARQVSVAMAKQIINRSSMDD